MIYTEEHSVVAPSCLSREASLIDLTHAIDESIPTWNGGCGFESVVRVDYDQCPPEAPFRVQKFSMNAGIGTHLDAPAHCIPGGKCIADLSLNELCVPLIVLDLMQPLHERSLLTVADIEQFECIHGVIPAHSFVYVRTGWGIHWHDRARYRNNHVFPAVSKEAAEVLLARNIAGLGIDTLSPDRPENGYPVHQLLLGAGKYIVENLAYGEGLRPTGGTVMVLPLKVAAGTEAPVRVVASVRPLY